MFVRLVEAHQRADDAIVLDSARRLSAFKIAAEAGARKLRFEPERGYSFDEPPAHFPFLRQLPELLADQERRARGMVRGTAPLRGDTPAARVAAIILNLEEPDAPAPTHRGSTVNGSAPVQELVAEGDAAVEPLLAAIETDTRMTRSVSYGRGPTIYHHVHPTLEPEFSALTMIYKTEQFSGQEYQVEFGKLSRRELAQSMREYWTKNRALPMPERWYRTLQDDAGGYDRWLEAAASIVQPSDQVGSPTRGVVLPALEPIAAAMKGEELRSRRDPSVSELLARGCSSSPATPGSRRTATRSWKEPVTWCSCSTDGTRKPPCPLYGRS